MCTETREIVAPKVKNILDKYAKDKGMLVAILQDIQTEFNYLPRPALEAVSEGLGVPMSQVYSVSTFFKAFSLKPKGKHSIHVCMGTACHVRGANKILDKLVEKLGCCAGENTADMKFSLDAVNCVGACALGPVVVVDGQYVGNMTTEKVKPLIEGCQDD